MKLIRKPRLLALSAILGSLMLLSCGGGDDKPSAPAIGPKPGIVAFSPSTGTVGTEFTITGINFRSGAKVWFESFEADSVVLVNSTSLYGYVPAGVDTGEVYSVTVRNIDGSAVRLDSVFTPTAPVLSYVNGATRPSGITGSTVIIEGNAFGDLQGINTVFFSDGAGGTIAAEISDPSDWTNTFIVTTVPSGAETGDVVVQTATGSSQALTFKITQNATFSPSTISWTETSALPRPLSGHACLYIPVDNDVETSEFACVLGGIDDQDTIRSNVSVASIEADGHLSSWLTASPLPEPRAFHAAVVATQRNSRVKEIGYIYVLGGCSQNDSDPVNTVYRAQLSADGSAGSWDAVLSLPVAMHSCQAVIFRSSIYVVGGSTVGNQPLNSVYRAEVDSLGLLDEWRSMFSLPTTISYHALTTFGGYLHVFGGDFGTVDPNDANYSSNETKVNDVLYMRIDLRSGNLATSTWTSNSSALVKAASKHTAVVAGGYVFVTGGLYNGASSGSSENKYAQFNSDGTLSSFHGATGSNTIGSLGGGNLFNHAALSYTDADGVAHVMVLGGDDVNSPGARHSGVWFY